MFGYNCTAYQYNSNSGNGEAIEESLICPWQWSPNINDGRDIRDYIKNYRYSGAANLCGPSSQLMLMIYCLICCGFQSIL
jgi:hypothetical protein